MPEKRKFPKSALLSWPLLGLGALLPLAGIVYLVTRPFELNFASDFSLLTVVPIKLLSQLF